MQRMYLRIRAPFAAFRGMQAGVYRSTAPTIPPSAAFGLLLNLAGIEMRGEDQGTTLIQPNIPRLRIAVGSPSADAPSVCTLYQQLHSYPVGASGKEFKDRAYGNKYWIAPVRREVLVDFEAILGAETHDATLPERISRGLRGELLEPRYGLPFAGDNNFLLDRVELLSVPPMTHWYTAVLDGSPRRRSCRLTVGIDRQDNSRTTVALLAPEETATCEPPESAWTWVPRETSPG